MVLEYWKVKLFVTGSINAVRKLNFADSRGLNHAVSSTNDASNTTLQDSDESSDVESMDRNTLQHNDIRNSSCESTNISCLHFWLK